VSCEACGGANTSYQILSGGREYWCRDCESEFPYRDDERPPRLQLMVDGRWDELRADMEEHFRREKDNKEKSDEPGS
jgi:hypothetical protein